MWQDVVGFARAGSSRGARRAHAPLEAPAPRFEPVLRGPANEAGGDAVGDRDLARVAVNADNPPVVGTLHRLDLVAHGGRASAAGRA